LKGDNKDFGFSFIKSDKKNSEFFLETTKSIKLLIGNLKISNQTLFVLD